MRERSANTQGLPLAGWRVVITRPAPDADALAHKIYLLGGQPQVMPVLEISTLHSESAKAAVTHLGEFDAVLLTSANAARALGEVAESLKVDLSSPPRWLAIAEKTAGALAPLGLTAQTFAGVGTGREFAEALVGEFQEYPHSRFLLLRGQLARPELANALRGAGHEVVDCVCYETRERKLPRAEWEGALSSPRTAILLFSPSAVHSLVNQAGEMVLPGVGERGFLAIAVGATTAAACTTEGLAVAAVAERPNENGMIDALVACCRHRQSGTIE